MPIEHTPKLPATITCTEVRVQKELPQIAKRPKSPQANNPQGTFGSNVPSTATSVSTRDDTAFGSPVSAVTPRTPDLMFSMPNTMQADRAVSFETPQPVLNARQEAQQSNPVAIDTPQTTPASPRYVAPNATPPKETLFSRLSEMFAPKPQ